MLKKVFILGLIGLFLFVVSGCNNGLTRISVEEMKANDVETDELKTDQDQEEIDEGAIEYIEGGPSAEKLNIFKEILDRVNSSENPGRRNTPNAFIYPDRDPSVYESWVNETYDLGVAFRDRVFSETGSKYGMTAGEVSEIYKEVSTWRADNNLF